MRAGIVRKDRSGVGQPWAIDLSDEHVTLIMPDGLALLRWTAPEAAKGVDFPSFYKSTKYAGFTVAGQGTYRFDIPPDALRVLRSFVDGGIVASGPAALATRLRRAVLESLGGLALTGGGAWLAYVTVREIQTGEPQTESRTHPAGFITAIVGFALLCHGVYGIWHCYQLKRRAAASR